MDLVAVIDEMLAQYGGLNIVSTKTEYAIPLKYKEENGVVELYADLAMIRPFAPLLDDLLGSLGDEAAFMGIKLADIVRLLLRKTRGWRPGCCCSGSDRRSGPNEGCPAYGGTPFFAFAAQGIARRRSRGDSAPGAGVIGRSRPSIRRCCRSCRARAAAAYGAGPPAP